MTAGQKQFHSGFVTIVGRPNVGKSTLLNSLIGEKISIVSKTPQTTRYQIRGILNDKNGQIVFIDTPGMHAFSGRLVRQLNTIAKKAFIGIDLILYVVDTCRRPGEEERRVVTLLQNQPAEIIMALNKIDRGEGYSQEYVSLWEAESRGRKKIIYYIPVSALTKKNIELLKQKILENLPPGEPFYPAGEATDFPLKLRIADLIREKLFESLQDELPHDIAVMAENIEEKEKITVVDAVVYVKRFSQKKIVIGKNGAMAKKIGTAARKDIEEVLGRKVYLQLWVKVVPDWHNKVRLLKELGYWYR